MFFLSALIFLLFHLLSIFNLHILFKSNKRLFETVFVYVGGEGRASNSPEGSSTEGGFPDGGGTKTGHRGSSTTVPGTGGCSTSIRIGSDTNYAREIVACGGGRTSGDSAFVNPGGFGGGLSGGNCSYKSSPQSQGAGTQRGSTNGLGAGSDGDPGQFGLGAACKYRKRSCSGGGGCSGWIFTESSRKEWQSGDSANASKFVLTDAICVGGNEEFPKPDGNGVECGNADNGYAKITPHSTIKKLLKVFNFIKLFIKHLPVEMIIV
ncbi:hypothetical protein M9Y10_012499 [Tritrichomonas musculus]|uniref:receptor protein-tyrosine kinase n=1 Tax=Tritrichomonas musculus TaxID=1915356 RepID=A0ABR2IDT6_9EUKA